MANVRVKVTDKHIIEGLRFSGDSCPIACAIKEQLNKREVDVGCGYTRVGRKRFLLPTEACQFITRFDNGLNVEPFEFELEIE